MFDRRASDGCIECGETDPACLDSHHRDGTEKEMTISEMVTHGYSTAENPRGVGELRESPCELPPKKHCEVPDCSRNVADTLRSDGESHALTTPQH